MSCRQQRAPLTGLHGLIGVADWINLQIPEIDW
jgi:hypothetical protein